jgi:hypothetical protein
MGIHVSNLTFSRIHEAVIVGLFSICQPHPDIHTSTTGETIFYSINYIMKCNSKTKNLVFRRNLPGSVYLLCVGDLVKQTFLLIKK